MDILKKTSYTININLENYYNKSESDNRFIIKSSDAYLNSVSGITVSAVTFYGNLDWNYITNKPYELNYS